MSGPPGQKYTFEQLPEAVKALPDGEDIDYEGASRPIDLDDKGDLSRYIYSVIRFQNGKLSTVKQVTPTASEQ